MLTGKQMLEIKEHLEKAQKPLFYYDNDADGLCSYVLLKRFYNKGKGVAIRSFPGLNKNYARKVKELNADYVFILDKPVIELEFFEEMLEIGIPVVWIDHHDIKENNIEELKEKFDNLFVYNWSKNKGKEKSDEPVTYWIYKTLGKKEDLWIALVGCISDHYLPEFSHYFSKEFPDLWRKGIKEPFDALFETEIGKIAEAFNFGLKDSTTNIVKFQNFLCSVKFPKDVFEETNRNYEFRKKYSDIKKKFNVLIEKASKEIENNLLFFSYGGDLSISSEVANKLSHIFKDKFIVVIYRKEGVSNVSMRGKKAKDILENILEKNELENASGGGHEDAVGARIKTSDLDKFKKMIEAELILNR